MLPAEIIRKKRDRHRLETQDLQDFFLQVSKGSVEDYQTSAMLMAIFLNGFDSQETSDLTKVMRDSGVILDWKWQPLPVVDKHSTGGVGDKTSLILLPLCALYDVVVPMISGRGLGHTGGTLDKLESIPGMNVFLDAEKAKQIVRDCRGVFLGQTGEVAPLDKKLYALRDVTATVESIPLITASILSKKLAAGISSLVMDIKYGSGAFMQELTDAKALANSLVAVGTSCGLKMRSFITNMGTPLGRAAGHSLEVIECIDIMKGSGPRDTRDLTVELAVAMLQGHVKMNDVELRADILAKLANGAVMEKFCQIIAAQGGDVKYLHSPQKFKEANILKPVFANGTGYICHIDVRAIGLAIVELGGGRAKSSDKINPSVGLSEIAAVGEAVGADQPLAMIHAESEKAWQDAAARIKSAYKLQAQAFKAPPLIESTVH